MINTANLSTKLPKKHTYPLALFMAKYAVYTLTGVLLILLVTYYGILGTVLYPANWGERHISRYIDSYSTMTNSALKNQKIPSAYHYILADTDKKIQATDISENLQARSIVQQACANVTPTKPSSTPVELHSSVDTQGRCFVNASGSYVVLSYTTVPRFTHRYFRDLFPSGDVILLLFFLASTGIVIALISTRQARLLQRELHSFADIAEHIEHNNLEMNIPHSSITEFNRTLNVFDTMRTSLKDSLDAQYATEEKQRKHIQALTHDMKTPLTVLRGNVELLGTTSMSHEQSSYADAILSATDTIDSYVSRLSNNQLSAKALPLHELWNATQKIVKDFCTASADSPDYECILVANTETTSLEIERFERTTWERIISNILSNSVAHAKKSNGLKITLRATVSSQFFTVTIVDNGVGFSHEALTHATQWSYTSQSAFGHQGIGLAATHELIRSMNGTMHLSNSSDGGAQVTLQLPLV